VRPAATGLTYRHSLFVCLAVYLFLSIHSFIHFTRSATMQQQETTPKTQPQTGSPSSCAVPLPVSSSQSEPSVVRCDRVEVHELVYRDRMLVMSTSEQETQIKNMASLKTAIEEYEALERSKAEEPCEAARVTSALMKVRDRCSRLLLRFDHGPLDYTYTPYELVEFWDKKHGQIRAFAFIPASRNNIMPSEKSSLEVCWFREYRGAVCIETARFNRECVRPLSEDDWRQVPTEWIDQIEMVKARPDVFAWIHNRRKCRECRIEVLLQGKASFPATAETTIERSFPHSVKHAQQQDNGGGEKGEKDNAGQCASVEATEACDPGSLVGPIGTPDATPLSPPRSCALSVPSSPFAHSAVPALDASQDSGFPPSPPPLYLPSLSNLSGEDYDGGVGGETQMQSSSPHSPSPSSSSDDSARQRTATAAASPLFRWALDPVAQTLSI